MHITSQSPILYFGTPVILITTLNEDGSYNIAPASSVFWLGWRCMIGLGLTGKTSQNILRNKECVINLPSADQAAMVNRLAKTTGMNPVPPPKEARGYEYVKEKFELAGLNPKQSTFILTPRIAECPVQMEAVLEAIHELAQHDPVMRGKTMTFELRILRLYIEESITLNGNPDKVDPDKWRPLIMSFQEFYGLGEKLHPSTLATIPEHLYKTADWQKASSQLS